MAGTLAELEARVAALEANQDDHWQRLDGVRVAMNALAANQRDCALRLNGIGSRLNEHGRYLRSLDEGQAALQDYVRSLDEGQAELKDLIIRALDQR